MFIGRAKELQVLQREYDRQGASLVIVYGRRRLGKTTLCEHFAKDYLSLYFLATEENETENRKAFQRRLASFTGSELLASANVPDWDTLFRVFAAHRPEERKILILDEFQYLGKANAAFPSIFQRIYDEILSNNNIMVILCGSLVRMMECQTLSYSSPLYSRRTAQIRLSQIPLSDYAQFYPDLSPSRLLPFYAVTGGVPKYAELFQPEAPLEDMIANHILDRSSFLYEEPTFLLQGEVSEIGSYFALLKTIAAGQQRLGNIAARLEVPQSHLTRYLHTLAELDLISRIVPVTERTPKKSKRGLYRLTDNYLRFWFRFVYPYRDSLERGHLEAAAEMLRRSFVSGHLAYVYEDLCRDYIWTLSSQQAWPFPLQSVGKWWSAAEEIDIVGLHPEEPAIIFGECKYWRHPVGMNILADLQRKAAAVDWHKKERAEYYILFSACGFSPDLQAAAREDPCLHLVSYGGPPPEELEAML